MDFLSHIAEARIRDAMARGDFDDLPGRGKPLELEDLSRVPEELRAGYILLKNAGFAPEELELRKDVLELRDLLAACRDGLVPEARAAGVRDRLRRAQLRFELLAGRRADSPALGDYADALMQRFGGTG